MTLEIIPRSAWKARAPRSRLVIPTPTIELWAHHSAGTEAGPAGMRRIQNFHMDKRGWSDIAYSFVIDRADLTIYEGRGAGVRGGHTFGRNSRSHGICVMGNFQVLSPTDELVERLAELVAFGHGEGWWPDRFTGGHRDVRATSCPGDNLYDRLDDINELATGGTAMADREREKQHQEYLNSFGFDPHLVVDGWRGDLTIARETLIVETFHARHHQIVDMRSQIDGLTDLANHKDRQIRQLQAELADVADRPVGPLEALGRATIDWADQVNRTIGEIK